MFGSLPTEPSSSWSSPPSRSLLCCRLPQKDCVWISSWKLVEKEINGGNPAVPGNDEISPGVSWRLTKAARYPLDPPAIAQFLGPGNWLISKVRVGSLDRARDAIDLVAATVEAPGLVKHAIFGEDLVDCRAPKRGVVFTEDVVKIAGEQGRYAVGHGLSPLGIECGLRFQGRLTLC